MWEEDPWLYEPLVIFLRRNAQFAVSEGQGEASENVSDVLYNLQLATSGARDPVFSFPRDPLQTRSSPWGSGRVT